MTLDEIFNIIKAHCHEVLGKLDGHVITRQDKFKDIGANSIDRAEIIELTIDALRIDVPRIKLFGAETLGDLAEVFHSKVEID